MKTIDIGHVRIPFDDYLTQGTALLGIRGAGKTYTAKGIAEQMLDHSVPIIVFDAIGVWRNKLTGGEKAVFEIAVNSYPNSIDRDAVSEGTGYQRSSRDTFIQRLSARRLITTTRDGIRAADHLFK